MIYIGLGSNLSSVEFGPPRSILTAALDGFNQHGMVIVARSPWYRSRPEPPSGQPWFINAIVAATSRLEPAELLEALHRLEAEFGRVRGERNAARTIDLDLIDYHGLVQPGGAGEPILPHPRLHQRAFVLRPLQDIAPTWRHPVSGLGPAALLTRLMAEPGADQVAEPLGA